MHTSGEAWYNGECIPVGSMNSYQAQYNMHTSGEAWYNGECIPVGNMNSYQAQYNMHTSRKHGTMANAYQWEAQIHTRHSTTGIPVGSMNFIPGTVQHAYR